MSALAPFCCAFCPQTLENFSHYSEHIGAAHPGHGAYFCCLCRTTFGSLVELDAHEGPEAASCWSPERRN